MTTSRAFRVKSKGSPDSAPHPQHFKPQSQTSRNKKRTLDLHYIGANQIAHNTKRVQEKSVKITRCSRTLRREKSWKGQEARAHSMFQHLILKSHHQQKSDHLLCCTKACLKVRSLIRIMIKLAKIRTKKKGL